MSRTTIKAAVQTAITGAATAAGTNVDIDRTDPWQEDDLPAVTIRSIGEEVEYTTAPAGRTRLHQLALEVVATAKATSASTATENLDSLLDEIDAALSDHTLGATARDLRLGDLEYEINSAGSLTLATAAQALTIIYTSSEP